MNKLHDTSLVEEVMEAMHRSLPSPRKDKWVELSGFSRDYIHALQMQAEAAITTVSKWGKENASV